MSFKNNLLFDVQWIALWCLGLVWAYLVIHGAISASLDFFQDLFKFQLRFTSVVPFALNVYTIAAYYIERLRHQQEPKFTVFNQLPTELRLQIWEAAFPKSEPLRVLEVGFRSKGDGHGECKDYNCLSYYFHGHGYHQRCDRNKKKGDMWLQSIEKRSTFGGLYFTNPATEDGDVTEPATGMRVPAMFFACQEARQVVLKHSVLYLRHPYGPLSIEAVQWRVQQDQQNSLRNRPLGRNLPLVQKFSSEFPSLKDCLDSTLQNGTTQNIQHLAIDIMQYHTQRHPTANWNTWLGRTNFLPRIADSIQSELRAGFCASEFLDRFENLRTLSLVFLRLEGDDQNPERPHFADVPNPNAAETFAHAGVELTEWLQRCILRKGQRAPEVKICVYKQKQRRLKPIISGSTVVILFVIWLLMLICLTCYVKYLIFAIRSAYSEFLLRLNV